jgi:acyl-CoA synthetase (AMP-forming)/AMP-acid ligase II
MGLVGCCLTPIMAQISIDYIPTTGFARRPLTWLKVMTEQRGTISFAPTFGYELCVRRAAKGDPQTYDLSAWRVAGVGSLPHQQKPGGSPPSRASDRVSGYGGRNTDSIHSDKNNINHTRSNNNKTWKP